MNTPTFLMTVFIFWIVMCVGYLSRHGQLRDQGNTRFQTLVSTHEGRLFALSVIIPVCWLIFA